jgi:hypothetical protein
MHVARDLGNRLASDDVPLSGKLQTQSLLAKLRVKSVSLLLGTCGAFVCGGRLLLPRQVIRNLKTKILRIEVS